MSRLLPFALLIAVGSIFGISWIIFDYDPENSPWYIFVALVVLISLFIFCSLGLLLYFVRTRRYRRYSSEWYFRTSFKMAFFVALFIGICATLAILQIVNLFNVLAAIVGVGLFAVWAYLGKNSGRKQSE